MTTYIAKRSSKWIDRLTQIESMIGNTPLYNISKVYNKPGVEIFAKLEWYQLGASVKSRPAFHIIKEAILSGKLTPGKSLLDATSGNTGIAYAAIGASIGVPVTLCLPENASEERKRILCSYGAEIIFTSRFESTDGAQETALGLSRKYPERYYYADQYSNEYNWKAHYLTTGQEIWKQTSEKVTHFVAGLGTTGTFMGTSKRLKELNPNIRMIGLQPNNPMHSLEGWKHLETAKVPNIYDAKRPDRIIEIDTLEAFDMVKRMSLEEGLLISPSAAANLLGAIKVAGQVTNGVVVTTFADSADKYTEVMNQLF